MRKKIEDSRPLAIIQHLTKQTLYFAGAAPEAVAVIGDVILALNRLAGATTTAADIEQVIARLLSLLNNSPVRQAYVAIMMEGLNELAQIHGVAARPAASPAEAAARSARRRTDTKARYEVRVRGEEEMLIETRVGSGNPSSVSRSDYDAAIAAMVMASEEGQRFDDLLANFHVAGGGEEPYRLRVVLRFWRLGGPPLVTRRSARYTTLVPPQLFAAAADALWHQQRPQDQSSAA